MTIAPDLHTSTGAYAAHALDGPERAAFERHLAACPACAEEVAEFAATLARLGAAEAAVPPAALRQQVLDRLPSVRQHPPHIPAPDDDGRRGRFGRSLPRLALAASVAAAVLLGGVAVQQHQQAEQARAQAARLTERQAGFESLLTAPDARTSTGSAGSGVGTVVWSQSRNQAAFLAAGMPALPAGSTYELWFNDAGTMRPAGLMPATDGALLLDGAIGGAAGIGVTVEPSGGSSRPSGTPVLLLPFT
ncbi:anti-sigma factor [Kitasatospora sp. NPDC002040]|uniref:anti-sigma factor n=1 Tax=Kitasatospora sp. NPDC002040 TaxID=3154661 RepID=UPI00333351F8